MFASENISITKFFCSKISFGYIKKRNIYKTLNDKGKLILLKATANFKQILEKNMINMFISCTINNKMKEKCSLKDLIGIVEGLNEYKEEGDQCR